MTRRLCDLVWPELDDEPRLILAVPLGSTEQHGPHLPLSTDTDIAVAVAERLAAVRDDVVVGPALPYGSSGEHAGFPGTLSIGQEALEAVVVELVRSAAEAFVGVVFVCGHGGNAEALSRAASRVRHEGHDVLVFFPKWEGDAHAGRAETAMMLALRPGDVQLHAAVSGNTGSLSVLLPRLRDEGVKALSPSGVLGDPKGATATEGDRLLAAAATQLVDAVARWRS